jgi:hypothetical protein
VSASPCAITGRHADNLAASSPHERSDMRDQILYQTWPSLPDFASLIRAIGCRVRAVNHNGAYRLAVTLFYIGIAIGAFGFFVLPILLVRHFLLWSECNGSNLLYRIPAFSTLLGQETLTENGICIFELFCAFVFLFRICYVVAFWKTIIDWHVRRMVKLGIDPTTWFLKALVILSLVFFSIFVISLSPASEVNSFGAERMAALLTSSIVLFVFTIPELILWFWFLVFGKIETQ